MNRYTLLPMFLTLANLVGADTISYTDLSADAVLVLGSVEVEITQGDTAKLQVRGERADLQRQPFYLRGDTLVLGANADHDNHDYGELQYRLQLPVLEQLALKGSGDVYIKPLTAASLLLTVAGSGDIKAFAVTAEDTTLRVEGSGDIKVAELVTPILDVVVAGSGDVRLGHVELDVVEAVVSGAGAIEVQSATGLGSALEMSIIGGGEIDFTPVDVHYADINIVGSGEARLGEVKAMEVNVIGSGDVSYSGEPEIDSNVIGSGDLNRRH